MTIVSRESVIAELTGVNEHRRMHYIGRALIVLLKNQTDSEVRRAATEIHNMEGFTSADAYSGTLTAKYYMKHDCLCDWQINKWIKTNKNGVPRLAKYWKQLNKAAEKKLAA